MVNTSFGKSAKALSWRYREKLASDFIAKLAATNQQTKRCDLTLFNTIADILEKEDMAGKETIGKGDDRYYLIPVANEIKIMEDRDLPLGDLKSHCQYKPDDSKRSPGGKRSAKDVKKAKKKSE